MKITITDIRELRDYCEAEFKRREKRGDSDSIDYQLMASRIDNVMAETRRFIKAKFAISEGK